MEARTHLHQNYLGHLVGRQIPRTWLRESLGCRGRNLHFTVKFVVQGLGDWYCHNINSDLGWGATHGVARGQWHHHHHHYLSIRPACHFNAFTFTHKFSIILALSFVLNLKTFCLKSFSFGLKYTFLNVLVEVMNCLSQKILISPLFLKDSFLGI